MSGRRAGCRSSKADRLGFVVACFAAAVASIFPAAARAQAPADRFAYERPVTASASGPHRMPIDLPLLSGGRPFRVVSDGDARIAEGGLLDLRFFDAQGRSVPHLFIQPARAERPWDSARVLPIAVTKKTSGFEADLGAAAPVDAIRVDGLPAPLLKRLVLEGSGDRERWTLLAAEGTLFDLPDERLRQLTLGFEPGTYRYLRVTWDDTNSGRVPLPSAVSARRASPVPPAPVAKIDLTVERRASEPGRSRYRLRLPSAKLPIVALEIDAAGGHVFRQASVFESRFAGTEATPAELGQATLIRVVRDGVIAGTMRVPIAAPSEPELELTVEDGANAPLEIRGVSAVLAQLPWIYLEVPDGPVVARYGNPALQAASFDLEAVRDSVDVAKVRDAGWGAPRTLTETAAAPTLPVPAAGAEIDAAPFRYSRAIPDGAAGLAALPLDAAALTHSRGPSSRFADVRVIDAASRQIPYLIERRSEPLSLDVSVKPGGEPKSGELSQEMTGRRSIYTIALPYAQLPQATLVIETSARVFDRRVRVGVERPPDRRHRAAWFETLDARAWRHVDQEAPAAPLSITVPTTDATGILLVVEEGDNAPLPIASARILLPAYRLRFYHPADASLRLVYGRDDLQPPRYDLALLAPQVMGAAAREVSAAAEQPGAASATPPLLSPTVFWILLGVSVVVLLGLIARLIRN